MKYPIGHKAAKITTGLAAFAVVLGGVGAVASASIPTANMHNPAGSATAGTAANAHGQVSSSDLNTNVDADAKAKVNAKVNANADSGANANANANASANTSANTNTNTGSGNAHVDDGWWQTWMKDWNKMWAAMHASGSTDAKQNGDMNKVVAKFNQGLSKSNDQFRAGVKQELNVAYNKIGDGNKQGLYTFYDRFKADNTKYDQMVSQAESQWRTDMANGMSRDAARNKFLDSFNSAKAWYGNDMNQAKDQLSGDLNGAGQAPAKDMFMNSFNKWMDKMSNQQEMLKNVLAKQTM